MRVAKICRACGGGFMGKAFEHECQPCILREDFFDSGGAHGKHSPTASVEGQRRASLAPTADTGPGKAVAGPSPLSTFSAGNSTGTDADGKECCPPNSISLPASEAVRVGPQKSASQAAITPSAITYAGSVQV